MADNVSTLSTPDCIVLQEKWNENIKRHPVAFSILFVLFVVVPLLLVFFATENRGIIWILILCLVAFFLLINILTIIKMFSPNHYEVSTTDGRIKILKNGVEVLNVKGEQITFLKFINNPVGKEITNLRISYVDDNSKTKFYSLPLAYIPKADCKELYDSVASFYVRNVNFNKQTDGENWKVNLVISLVLSVLMALFCIFSDEVSGKMIFALVASLFFLIYSIVKMANSKG